MYTEEKQKKQRVFGSDKISLAPQRGSLIISDSHHETLIHIADLSEDSEVSY